MVNILPPLNVHYEIIQRRGFLTATYLGKVSWDENPGNAAGGINVVKYNVYRKQAGDTAYAYYDSVDASTTLYYDQLGKEKRDAHYTATAVDDQGRESTLPYSTTRSSLASPPAHDEGKRNKD